MINSNKRRANFVTVAIGVILILVFRPWATLRLASRARASNHVPYFYQGETISGSVNLTLEKEDNIRAVEIEV